MKNLPAACLPAASLAWMLWLIIGGIAGASPGQLDSSFVTGTGPSSTVNWALEQPDGKLIVAGAFSSVNSTSLSRVARLGANGSVDPLFSPPASSHTINAIARQPDGKILVAAFQIGNYARYGIARLNIDGTLDTSFNADGVTVNSSVYSVAVQNDGKILIGGDFPGRIERLNANGSKDTTFNIGTGASSTVRTISVLPSGKILIGGSFSSVNGINRNYLAALNSDGSVDTSFGADGSGPSSTVNAIAVQEDGRILVGGSFSSVNGISQGRLARLEPDGTLDYSFSPSFNSTVYSVTLRADGRILVGGDFTTVDSTSIQRVVLLRADGQIDVAFETTNGASGSVRTVTQLASGKVLIGGSFTTYAGVTVNNLARLEGPGTSGVPSAGGLSVPYGTAGQSIELYGSNLADLTGIEFSGGVSAAFSIATPTRAAVTIPVGAQAGPLTLRSASGDSVSLISFYPLPGVPGTLDPSFDLGSGAGSTVYAIAEDNNGKVLIAGDFSTVNGLNRTRIARLDSDGRVDLSFTPPSGSSSLRSLAVQPNGKILVGGSSVGSQKGIARLNLDGSIDSSFNASAVADSYVYAIALQPDGKILIGGSFLRKIARLNADGSPDFSFDVGSGPSSEVKALQILPDGKILVGGSFSTVNGVSRKYVVRLSPDGTVDRSFGSDSGGPSSTVNTLDVQADGKIVIGGSFSSVNGTNQKYLARLEADGTLDASFTPSLTSTIYTARVLEDGRVAVGGSFDALDGAARNYVALLHADGTLDTGFNTANGPSGTIYAVLPQNGGRLLIGGSFDSLNGKPPARIARLLGDDGQTFPAISSFAPSSGAGGEAVNIFGSNLSALTSIVFSGAPASFSLISNVQAVAVVPATAMTGPISVRNTFGQGVSRNLFRILPSPLPVLTSFPAGPVPAGSSITITGKHFYEVTSVRIGVVEAQFSVESATAMSVIIPSGAVTGRIKLTSPGGVAESSTDILVVPAPPTITSSTTASGTVGRSFNFTITASNNPSLFGASPLPSGLSLNPHTGKISGVPTAAGETDMSVLATNAGGTANGTLRITIAPPPPPVVTRILPSSVTDDGEILIVGTYLTQTTQVTVGGVAAAFQVLSDERIVVEMPSGVASGTVQVTTQQGTASGSESVSLWSFQPGSQVVSGFGDGSSGQTTAPAGLDDAIAIAAGQYHSLALRADGSVVAWGGNWSGQTAIPSGLAPVNELSAGAHHSVALEADGSVVAWGRNDEGQCTFPTDLGNAIAVAAGGYHTLALRSDGTVAAWGANWSGQTDVPDSLGGVVSIAAGEDFSVALKADGTIVAWGENLSGQTDVPETASGIIAIAAGHSHVTALKANGDVISWGADWSGQATPPSGLSGVVQIAAGSTHNVALRNDGTIVAWGADWSGQASVPPLVTNAIAVAGGGDHSLILHAAAPVPRITSSLTAVGKPGQPFAHQILIANGPAILSTSNLPEGLSLNPATGEISGTPMSGGDFTISITARNAYGLSVRNLRIFVGPFVTGWGSGLPGPIPAGLGDVVQLAAGSDHCVALKSDGTVVAWGTNSYGQTTVPAGLTNVVAVGAGSTFSLALKTDGTVYYWGTVPGYYYPPPLPSNPIITNAVAIDAAGNSAVALLANGSAAFLFGTYPSSIYARGLLSVATGEGDYYSSSSPVLGIDRTGFVVDSYGNNVSESAGFETITLSRTGTPYYSPFDALPGWGIKSNGKVYELSVGNYYPQTSELLRTEVDHAVSISGGTGYALVLTASRSIVALTATPSDPYYPSYSVTPELPRGLVDIGAFDAGSDYGIAVKEPFLRPEITSLPVVDARVGSPFQYQIRTSALVTQFEASLLPAGLSVNPVSGLISGTPQNEGVFNCLVIARYADGFASRVVSFKFSEGATPHTLILAGTTITEDLPADTEVGTLSATDPDAGDSLSFSLTSGPGGDDNGNFKISGNKLLTSKPIDFEAKQQLSLRIQVTDSGGNSLARVFLINVQNVTSDDDDHDGLTESEEALLGTDRFNRDSDGDGATDGLEVQKATNPLSPSSKPSSYVAVWGYNNYGQCDVPADLGDVVAVAAGNYHSLALKADGTVAAWGYNSSGQCNVPPGLYQVVSIAAGYSHSLALKADGTVVAWGSSSYGLNSVPAGLSNVVEIAAGDYLNMALRADGSVVVWGTTSNDLDEVPAGLGGVVAMAAGDYHALVLKSNGAITGWGSNYYGEATPSVGINDAVALAAGNDFGLALQSGGTVVSWGDYFYNSGTSNSGMPPNLTDVVSIAAGGGFALAVHADGKLSAWGENYNGQTNIPAALGKVVMAVGGYYHGIALVSEQLPVRVLPSGNAGAVVGIAFNHQVAFTGVPEQLDASFLPPGITFDAVTGSLTGIPLMSGTFNIRVTARSDNARSVGIIQLTVRLPNRFGEWREAHFPEGDETVTGVMADPDADSCPNLLEYALNRDPNVFDSDPVFTSELLSIGTGQHLALTYEKLRNLSDVRIVVEVSDDLKTWHSGYPYTGVAELVVNGETETLTIFDRTSTTSVPRRFIRLRFEPIPTP